MPYYIRTDTGQQMYGAAIDALPALSVRVDAGLVRAPYADTWQAAGDGIPMPVEATVILYQTSPTNTAPTLPPSIAAVGYEDSPTATEWERAVLGWRGTRIAGGGLRGTGTEIRLILAPMVAAVSRWVNTAGDEMVDDSGIPLVFLEEV